MRRAVVQLPASAPTSTREQRVDSKPATAFASELRRLMEQYDLSQDDLAELISAYTGTVASRTTLGSWLRGATPRIEPDTLQSALERIEKTSGAPVRSRIVEASEVRHQTLQWLKLITRRELERAAEIPQACVYTYEHGLTTVERRRWERISAYVELYLKKRGLHD